MKARLLLQTALLLVLFAQVPPNVSGQEPARVAASHHMQRVQSVTGLRLGKAEYYLRLHAAAWPGVLRMIKECHIQNYSIALKEIDGKLFLFSYFEYTGDDLAADMKKMAADPETRRWWQETDPCQMPLPDAAARGKIWAEAREVFYTP